MPLSARAEATLWKAKPVHVRASQRHGLTPTVHAAVVRSAGEQDPVWEDGYVAVGVPVDPGLVGKAISSLRLSPTTLTHPHIRWHCAAIVSAPDLVNPAALFATLLSLNPRVMNACLESKCPKHPASQTHLRYLLPATGGSDPETIQLRELGQFVGSSVQAGDQKEQPHTCIAGDTLEGLSLKYGTTAALREDPPRRSQRPHHTSACSHGVPCRRVPYRPLLVCSAEACEHVGPSA